MVYKPDPSAEEEGGARGQEGELCQEHVLNTGAGLPAAGPRASADPRGTGRLTASERETPVRALGPQRRGPRTASETLRAVRGPRLAGGLRARFSPHSLAASAGAGLDQLSERCLGKPQPASSWVRAAEWATLSAGDASAPSCEI
ncbi:hypothetical protein NDU88_004674 [Pleurodeles waltl]|uniref:Uncharacterized protein n=1 Tax=Pleurodeles waltl TaxID=8319 RepID=A0AAV7L231_PLEWA|nr:hypothetical protein NDU88_004674 [Pleurodeles waltl]